MRVNGEETAKRFIQRLRRVFSVIPEIFNLESSRCLFFAVDSQLTTLPAKHLGGSLPDSQAGANAVWRKLPTLLKGVI